MVDATRAGTFDQAVHSTPTLRVRDVHKRFGRLEVLRGIDLQVSRGEILSLVGENGTGKSTIVHSIAGTWLPDGGTVELDGRPLCASDPRVAVVWQDLALCDNLSVVANLFLGDERRDSYLLDERQMIAEAVDLFDALHLTPGDLERPIGELSGGQRQLVAIARAVRRRPEVLALDEPTASLGVNETAVVEQLLAELRSQGTAILLVSHRLDQVFELADHIAVLRDGRILAVASPRDVHPDDVVAMMSGTEAVSSARRQLRRLHSLVEQLADVEPAASLPLIVSAMAEAVDVEQLCVHLLDESGGEPRLRCSATVGLDLDGVDGLDRLRLGALGGPPGAAAAAASTVIVEDTRTDPLWSHWRGRTLAQVRSCWSIPIVGAAGVLGTISAFDDNPGSPQPDQLELVTLYASHAAAAIERERLLADATRRNRMLETLRGVLDKLAGPHPAEGALGVALVALCRGLGADAIALHPAGGESLELVTAELVDGSAAAAADRQRAAAACVLRSYDDVDRARPVGPDVVAVPIATPDGRAVLTAWWGDADRLSSDALDLFDDAARSLSLALEREALERANAEAAALRRSHRLQRDFLHRLNHELRTPLTAIQGYASTLRQTDVSWDSSAQERFLDSIAAESARMGRLVGDLLDFSAIDSGTLRLVRDWCNLELVLEAARRCVGDGTSPVIELAHAAELPAVWADHDRLEQVFVNLLDNAVRHASGVTRINVRSSVDLDAGSVTVRVADDGRGIPASLVDRVFLPRERGTTDDAGAGLGLAIARGIVVAHGGTICIDRRRPGTTVVVTVPIDPSPLDSSGDVVDLINAVADPVSVDHATDMVE
ncbi:MAG TPA: ATP-binding cassette domain-containing protein [Acidimicrobiales bacterium]|nr:ATP-binding cassette domain-containing protein [Acidimicrobiales bacterium]